MFLFVAHTLHKLRLFWELMRFHKPIGILLLLWPTYWALWIAAEGIPDRDILLIFTLGVIIMRAAGCVINDIADYKIDKYVRRTQSRPITSRQISIKEASLLFVVLILCALMLVRPIN